MSLPETVPPFQGLFPFGVFPALTRGVMDVASLREFPKRDGAHFCAFGDIQSPTLKNTVRLAGN